MLKRNSSYHSIIITCLFAGAVAGCILMNLWYKRPAIQEIWAENLEESIRVIPGEARLDYFFLVLSHRLGILTAAWLVTFTSFAMPGFYILCLYLGSTIGIGITGMTLQKGIFGLPCYLFMIFPHCIFYVLAWYLLIEWAGISERRKTLHFTTTLAAIALLGVATETLWGSFLLK